VALIRNPIALQHAMFRQTALITMTKRTVMKPSRGATMAARQG
jgi:hypothetical protein